jgi:hypothetical protein
MNRPKTIGEVGIMLSDMDSRLKHLEDIYDIVNRQTSVTERLATEMRYFREDQGKLDKRVTNLEERPNKRFDSIVTTIISNVISLILGAVAVLIGLKR